MECSTDNFAFYWKGTKTPFQIIRAKGYGRPGPMFASEKCEATEYVSDEIYYEMK